MPGALDIAANRRAARSTTKERGLAPQLIVFAALVAVAVLVALLPASARALATPTPGTLESAFGQGGRVEEDFGTEPAREGQAEQAIATPDGGLLVRGRTSITRYLPDGSVDRGFGRDGSIVRVEGPIVMTTDSRGRILVVSGYEELAGSVTLERFQPDGSLDRSFGTGGSRTVKIARNRMGTVKALLTQPDGKLLLVGSSYDFAAEKESIGAMRLLPSGVVDRRYGSAGCASFTLPIVTTSWPKPVATLDGEELVLAAYSAKFYGEPSFLAVRFDAAGNLDPSFGNDGVVHDALVDGPTGIAADAEGRLTVVDGSGRLGRLLPDGTPDPSFGKEGVVALEDRPGGALAMSLAADGSVLLAGRNEEGSFVLERRLPDGSTDPSFGGGQGYASHRFEAAEGREVQMNGLALVPGRGALVYGSAPPVGEPDGHSQIAAVLFGPSGEPVQDFGAGGVLLSRPLAASQDFGFDLLAGKKGVTVTGRAAGGVLLRRFRPDGSVDRRFRSGQPTLPPSGAFRGDEGNTLAAAPGGGFFLGTGSGAGGEIFRFRSNGGLEAGFDQDGVDRETGLERILDVAPAKGGSIYAVGISTDGCWLELARLRPGGSLDPAFGRGGLRRIGFGAGPCTFHDVGLAPRRDGRIVAAGEVSEGILAEFAPSGRRLKLGRAYDPYLDSSERRRAIALDPRGRILLAGRFKHSLTVTRLTPSGAPDRSFGRDGVARVNAGRFAEAAALALEPDGKVVVAGFTELCPGHTSCHGSSPLVARLDPDGHLDRGFASGGVWTGKPGEAAGLKALALGPGSIYATGWVNRPHRGRDLLVLRLRR